MKSDLKNKLSPWLDTTDRKVGVFALHSQQGIVLNHNSDDVFYLASTYKVPIAVQCLRLIDAGVIHLDQWVEINPEDLPLYSPILDNRHFSYPGIQLHVKNLLRLMIEYSDNTASDIILKLSGGAPAVKNFLHEFGFSKNISIDLSTKEAFLLLEEGEAIIDSGTPEAMANFLKQMSEGKFLSAASTQFLSECMERCKTGSARIRALLPEGTVVASKTGTVSGYVNDIGIIDLPNEKGKLILAIYLVDKSVSMKESENVVANISKIIFDYVSVKR
jgi:beta-lactamase class A